MVKKVKDKIVVEFESVNIGEDGHIDKNETFEVAFAMYNTLHKVCPGCAMGVLSMLLSMLAIEYTKQGEERKELFDTKDWIEYIVNSSMGAIDKFEHTHTPYNN